MQSFVDSQGNNLSLIRTLSNRKTVVNNATPAAPNHKETPKERLARQKREKAEMEAEKLKQATREAFIDNQV